MKTRLLNPSQTHEASQILLEGGILAIPTDTVYGLAVCFNDGKAIEKLRHVKKRPEDKPFALMVSSLEMIEAMAELSLRDRQLIKACLPGDLTLILKKKASCTAAYFKDMNTIAFRIPNEAFILELINTLQIGLLVPSANVHGIDPCLHSDCVFKNFENQIEGIILGQSGQNEASTILDASQDVIKLVRQGRLTLEEILTKARLTK